ncbi:hypothetical protein Back2_17860 [Nocardioides baekrokdamisoli]|uniref:Uncharacterized protein n=1 Tax=Nocardioides baekrokdamisoli TaxID=1804624 RepID=A0A3G9J3B7_9ACTN|nr:hypothetical protein [Nocardioides baekrokdamisoli]BBH17499.1 hypothetical protein Back2_17860 [Nocardioides baekrokdamisoli]
MSLDIVVDDTRVLHRLQTVQERLEDDKRLLGHLSELLTGYIKETYDTADDGKWAPDDVVTTSEKGSSRILIDTGLLLRSLTDPHIDGEAVKATSGPAKYAGYLKAGARGTAKRDPLPAPSERLVIDWASSLLKHIVEEL